MLNVRTAQPEKKEKGAKESKFAAWTDRAYFVAGYCTGLGALGLIIFSIFGHLDLRPPTRERAGWDLSQPERIDPRTIGH
jgi:hypothetical protein